MESHRGWGSLCMAALLLSNASVAAFGATDVGPDEPVITVNDFCAAPSPGSVCKTVISRAQFEKLAEALQPGMSRELRLKVADSYGRLLRMAAAAHERGLDATPAFEEEMRFARMQLLAQDLGRKLREEANEVSEADVESYYKAHLGSYEEATIARIFVPGAKRAPTGVTAGDAAAAMTALAGSLRDRAIAGEDPDKLQLEAYAAAGTSTDAPHTRMEHVRRASLPPSHEWVMDMKPGEVSAVQSDPGGGHFIYKMINKISPGLAAVSTEIRSGISRQRYQDSMRVFEGNVALSDAYFAPSGPEIASPHRHRRVDASAH